MAAKTNERHGSRNKVQAYRQRLRARGLRPVQIWIPDTRTPAFRAAAHSQSVAVATSRLEQENQAFIDAISEPGEE